MKTIDQQEIIGYLIKEQINGYFLAMLSDSLICQSTDFIKEIDPLKLIEIRVFNETKEIKAVRGSLEKEFQIRTLEAESNEEEKHYEVHYLDIDEKRKPQIVTTGGGKYELPIEAPQRIKICNHLRYDENGVCQIVDYRIVKFLAKGEK